MSQAEQSEDETVLVSASTILAHTDGMWRTITGIVEGLTDEEFLWEPVEGCWTVRRHNDGTVVQDWAEAPPVPPFTTIAWRLAHIALWRGGIAAAGPHFVEPLAIEVLSFNDHHLGHAKEIDTIRQLFRAQRPWDLDPLVEACLRGDVDTVRALTKERAALTAGIGDRPELVRTAAEMGRWNVVTALVERGWPVETNTGPTPLHYAALSGAPLGVVQFLIEHGADIARQDPHWHATPRVWAEYLGRLTIARHLADLETTI